jgi:hypothetical protein
MTNTGSISFASNADDTLPPITFTRSVTLPKTYALSLSAIPDATAGDVVKLKVKAAVTSGQWSGVSTLDFVLTYNTDLLDYRSASSNCFSTNGKNFQIRGNPITVAPDSTIGELTFKVMLTKDSITDIVMTDAHLNISDPSFEKCVTSITQTGSSFTYQYVCGDHFIQHYMRGETLPLKIVSLKPNPAQNEVAVELDAADGGIAMMEVYDELGKRVMRKEIAIVKGRQKVTISTADIAEGMYSVRLGNVSGRFVKVQ